MQLSKSLLLVVAATITCAFAKDCGKGYNYCGDNLLSIGNYLDQMVQEASDNGRSSGNAMVSYLYKCVDAGDRAGPGVIEFIEDCAKGNGWHCSDNGGGNNDSCKAGS
ncbi:hypothetical protein B0H34DRAFT_797212 [Crassisporium funariophilum]|nr:hypothetical protein B0H34DRAFT_797212 [Crassisporium funariophilum]